MTQHDQVRPIVKNEKAQCMPVIAMSNDQPAVIGRRLRGPDMLRYNSVERAEALINWVLKHSRTHGMRRDHEIGPLFWQLVKAGWPLFDRIEHEMYAMVFKRFRQWWTPQVEWHRLPERLTIWRGHDETRVRQGLSWTRDRRVAEGFARGHRHIFHSKPRVLRAEITRADVALVIDGRKENEVVLFAPVDRASHCE
jgi:hypothetical protein